MFCECCASYTRSGLFVLSDMLLKCNYNIWMLITGFLCMVNANPKFGTQVAHRSEDAVGKEIFKHRKLKSLSPHCRLLNGTPDPFAN